MGVIEVAIDGQMTTFATAKGGRKAKTRTKSEAKTPTKLKPGYKEFGEREEKGNEEAIEQVEQADLVEVVEPDEQLENGETPKRKYGKRDTRELLRKKLRTLVREALAGGEKRAVDFANLKIVYELLLKDEAAELERQKLEGAFATKVGPVVVTQEEMTVYVRRLLGKEITL